MENNIEHVDNLSEINSGYVCISDYKSKCNQYDTLLEEYNILVNLSPFIIIKDNHVETDVESDYLKFEYDTITRYHHKKLVNKTHFIKDGNVLTFIKTLLEEYKEKIEDQQCQYDEYRKMYNEYQSKLEEVYKILKKYNYKDENDDYELSGLAKKLNLMMNLENKIEIMKLDHKEEIKKLKDKLAKKSLWYKIKKMFSK